MFRSIFLAIFAAITLSSSFAFAKEMPAGTISGKILGKNGESMSGGKILLFRAEAGPPPSRHKYWRTPDEIVDINSDGTFSANVTEGTYYLAAVKRMSTGVIGPPQEGDLIYPYSRDELKSENREYLVKRNSNTNVGTIAEAVIFKAEPDVSNAGITAIEGLVTDIQGKPLSGAMAFAYKTADLTGKPLFTSARTGKDGKYSIRLSEGGSYFIKIRNTSVGGHPIDGEIIGVYGNDDPVVVTVATGKVLKHIDVTGRQFDELLFEKP